MVSDAVTMGGLAVSGESPKSSKCAFWTAAKEEVCGGVLVLRSLVGRWDQALVVGKNVIVIGLRTGVLKRGFQSERMPASW